MSGLFGSTCDKCGKKSSVLETSVFDVSLMICPECYDKERDNPNFESEKIALRNIDDEKIRNLRNRRKR